MATDKEMVTAPKFNESVKNALRDYYVYGFKKWPKKSKASQTQRADWQRLQAVLPDYLTWSELKISSKADAFDNYSVRYVTVDSQAMDENPFLRVYRFSNYRNAFSWLNHLCIICQERPFNDDYLNRKIDETHSNRISEFFSDERFYESPENILDKIDELEVSDNLKEGFKKAVYRGMQWDVKDIEEAYEGLFKENGKKLITSKSIVNHLKVLNSLGVVQRVVDGQNVWRISESTLNNLVTYCSNADTAFEQHLRSAIDFYSRYYFLGEIGIFLLDRFGPDYKSPFRFKNEYYMHSLNDFHLIDLLEAIEKKQWCYIKYKNELSDINAEILCYPIQIRTGFTEGKQALICYEPFKRNCISLRLEFIDEIDCYNSADIETLLYRESFSSTDWANQKSLLESDIRNASAMVENMWGINTSNSIVGNVVDRPKFHSVKLRIGYDVENEAYIRNRIIRERRFGNVTLEKECAGVLDFQIEVFDVKEMRPWVRSFYKRIISCEGLEASEAQFIQEDLVNFSALWGREFYQIPEIFKTELEKIQITQEKSHDQIFNGLFSVYNYILMECAVLIGQKNEIDERNIRQIVKKVLAKYHNKVGKVTGFVFEQEAVEQIIEYGCKKCGTEIDGGNFSVKKYKPIYHFEKDINFYREVLPITITEVRWLKTILNDEKISIFMSEEECAVLKKWLDSYADNSSEYDIKAICYYDRYYSKEEFVQERKFMNKILYAIEHGKHCGIVYGQRDSDISSNFSKGKDYYPITVEYSKRNNCFQLYVMKQKKHAIEQLNMADIVQVEIIYDEPEFEVSVEEALVALKEYRKGKRKSVEITFRNEENLLENILTEFAPYEKICEYDEGEDRYTLKLYYSGDEGTDVAVRLMSYGPYIRFVDKENLLAKMIRTRVEAQIELFKEQERMRREKIDREQYKESR